MQFAKAVDAIWCERHRDGKIYSPYEIYTNNRMVIIIIIIFFSFSLLRSIDAIRLLRWSRCVFKRVNKKNRRFLYNFFIHHQSRRFREIEFQDDIPAVIPWYINVCGSQVIRFLYWTWWKVNVYEEKIWSI